MKINVIGNEYKKALLEIHSKIEQLKSLGNLIIKFGRFVPNALTRYDEILGVTLASENQYAEYYE